MEKVKIDGFIKVNAYNVFVDCIERGIDYGYQRAFKHTKTPDENTIKESIYNSIINEVSEFFEFNN